MLITTGKLHLASYLHIQVLLKTWLSLTTDALGSIDIEMRYVKKNKGGFTLLSSGRKAVLVTMVMSLVVALSENEKV
mgnify:CR=1 FL=1